MQRVAVALSSVVDAVPRLRLSEFEDKMNAFEIRAPARGSVSIALPEIQAGWNDTCWSKTLKDVQGVSRDRVRINVLALLHKFRIPVGNALQILCEREPLLNPSSAVSLEQPFERMFMILLEMTTDKLVLESALLQVAKRTAAFRLRARDVFHKFKSNNFSPEVCPHVWQQQCGQLLYIFLCVY